MMNQTSRPQVELHEARSQQDAEQLATLAREIWTEHYEPIIGPGQVAYMLARFQSAEQIFRDMTQNGFTYLWLSSSREPVAYIAWQDKPEGSCFLSKLYVKKAYRGYGLARLLLNSLLEHCREHNLSRIWLTVNKNNKHSIEAYKKMSFHVVESVVKEIGCGYVMDDYVMQLQL